MYFQALLNRLEITRGIWVYITCNNNSFLSSQEAQKKDEKLLKFPEKLQDIQSASR